MDVACLFSDRGCKPAVSSAAYFLQLSGELQNWGEPWLREGRWLGKMFAGAVREEEHEECSVSQNTILAWCSLLLELSGKKAITQGCVSWLNDHQGSILWVCQSGMLACSGVLLELSGKKVITRGTFCDSFRAGCWPVLVFCWSGQGLSEQDVSL